MDRYIIEGGHRLGGTVRVSGNKNEALPVLAATLMTAEPVIIHNVPRIGDVNLMLEIIKYIMTLLN